MDERGALELERRFMSFGTARLLSSAQRTMLEHCVSAVTEALVEAPQADRARWCALLHLTPRLLVSSASLRRAASAAPRPFMRRRRGGRRRHASTDHVDTVFRDRCYAFMTGDWRPLFIMPPAARRLFHEADDERLAHDVLALVPLKRPPSLPWRRGSFSPRATLDPWPGRRRAPRPLPRARTCGLTRTSCVSASCPHAVHRMMHHAPNTALCTTQHTNERTTLLLAAARQLLPRAPRTRSDAGRPARAKRDAMQPTRRPTRTKAARASEAAAHGHAQRFSRVFRVSKEETCERATPGVSQHRAGGPPSRKRAYRAAGSPACVRGGGGEGGAGHDMHARSRPAPDAPKAGKGARGGIVIRRRVPRLGRLASGGARRTGSGITSPPPRLGRLLRRGARVPRFGSLDRACLPPTGRGDLGARRSRLPWGPVPLAAGRSTSPTTSVGRGYVGRCDRLTGPVRRYIRTLSIVFF